MATDVFSVSGASGLLTIGKAGETGTHKDRLTALEADRRY